MSAPRIFHLHLADPEQDVCRGIEAETFFEARAKLAQELGVEPGDVRLDPPARMPRPGAP